MRLVVDGYPTPEPDGVPADRVLGARLVGGPMTVWIGSWQGSSRRRRAAYDTAS